MGTLNGLIRHLLTFGGGFLVAKGYFDEATLNELVGALTTVIGIAWSAVAKSDKFPAIK